MLKNYLITAYRSLKRNKAYTILNVLGLTLGITCFVLVGLYVENEWSHDRFISHPSYRFLLTEQTGDGEERTYGTVGVKTFNTIEEQISGVEDILMARDHGAGPLLVEHDQVKFKSRKFFFSEPEFFDYFDIELLQGNAQTALAEPQNVVINASTARRIFGEANPIGEMLHFSGSMNFTVQVTGVIEDVKNSHLQFDFLFNFNLRDEKEDYQIIREGFANSVYGYFTLSEGVAPEEVAGRIKAYYKELYRDNAEVYAALDRESYVLQPVHDIYFGSNHVTFDEGFKKGNKDNLLLLATIGFFILTIACMNYINASTAKAIKRVKEIGVRKVFGAYRIQLFSQFMGEALLVTLLAVLFSILLTDLALPYFENFMQTSFRHHLLANPVYWWGLFFILILVTLLAGTYPAVFVSGLKPGESLRQGLRPGWLRGNGLRSLLVGTQLFFAALLMSSIFLILKQNKFLMLRELGFSKNDILIVPNNSQKVADQLTTYKNELLKSPYIYAATTGMDVLGFGSTNNSGTAVLDGQSIDRAPVSTYFTVGMDFLEIQEIEVVAGRSFAPGHAADSSAVLVNEAFVRANGLSIEQVLEQRLRLYGPESGRRPIIGVVKDFNFQSLHSKVAPAVFTVSGKTNWFWTIKIDPNRKKEAIAHVKNSWEAIETNYPMGYWFLEDNINGFYEEETKLQKAIQVFAILCIVISCLGIYGLTAYTIERRIKEIGVRKVLGAGVKQLVWLVNQKFVYLFAIAFLASVPLVYYFIDQWLQSFAYRINIGVSAFALAGLTVLVVLFLTVSIQAVKAALCNPAQTLRSE
ncbi:ABC transporter permease [Roseivirga thermotolerans]|uniref:ABC transporter permease n=1 Tax=Roseivirga thermotolerans TaxID=1758176 RepID=A0ABQ3I568_9BACT|nr:ABC transporter permease [Roseivirga thermotolerans]GHE63636.1 ABC transporter permease [Roseivirga thermotolerans]